jgi:type II secretory pathway component PulK
MVLWAIALMALVLVAIQSSAFRQAAAGREAVARVRAQWAARAGVEATIARLTQDTISPDISSALTVYSDLASVARADVGPVSGGFAPAAYSIRHFDGTQEVDGPEDAHSKLNVNTLTTDDLILLDAMDDTTAQSIHNWIHGVDETALTTGADEGNYTGLRYPYKPRGAPVRSLKELELVQGVDPRFLRGDDANYNGRLDPGEDEGDGTPTSTGDGMMDAGWTRYLTAVSEVDKPTSYSSSGNKKLDLRTAGVGDITERLRVDQNQAQAISSYANGGTATLVDFVRTDLGTLAQTAAAATLLNGQQQQTSVTALSTDQLRALVDECVISSEVATQGVRSGKFNINTVSRETLQQRFDYFFNQNPELGEAILTERDARSGGFLSMVDLLDIPNMTNDILATLMGYMDVRSNVFVVSSRGRDRTTGIEVEIVAVIDRTSIPVVIRDLSVR